MGVPEDYPLPNSYNEAYHLMGDGLVVPVVQWLEKHLLWPLAEGACTLHKESSIRQLQPTAAVNG
jgi:DNA (cytosine-5)-methyltransferase 1